MKLTKEDLCNIESIELALENCEYFDIPASEVLDINFPNILEKEGSKVVEEGYILLSKNATNILSSMSDDFDNEEYVEREFYSLKNRLKNYCDLCYIGVKFNDGGSCSIGVPFDPLEGGINWFIEYTNCSSAEITNEGNMMICCGKSSKVATRIDNNYNDLIVWFDDRIKQKFKEKMSVRIDRLATLKDITKNIEMDCKILNNQLNGMNLSLEFCDVSHLDFDLDFDKNNKYCLSMSRLQDNKIFVSVSNVLEFRCRAIIEHSSNPYSDNGAYEEYSDFIDVLSCAASGEKVVDLAYNHYASDVSIKKEYILNVFEKVFAKSISLEYFRGWLKLSTDLMRYYIGKPFASKENAKIIAKELCCLYFDLLYYNNMEDCADLIKNKFEIVKDLLLK